MWQVTLSRKAKKQAGKLPRLAKESLFALLRDIEAYGPIRGDWPNYSKLDPGRHHCHIKKGKPCYVAVWEEHDRAIKLVEVIYVGTYEKAPY